MRITLNRYRLVVEARRTGDDLVVAGGGTMRTALPRFGPFAARPGLCSQRCCAWFTHCIADLEACRLTRFTDNFILLDAMPGTLDWADDAWVRRDADTKFTCSGLREAWARAFGVVTVRDNPAKLVPPGKLNIRSETTASAGSTTWGFTNGHRTGECLCHLRLPIRPNVRGSGFAHARWAGATSA